MVKAAAPAVVHFVQAAAPVVASVADSALGISSMIGDVKTLFDPSKSWTDKLLSVADLAVNVAMDVDTITGTGEAARAAYMGLKVGVKMAGKAAEHAAIDEAEHLAVKEGEHAVEGEGEHLAEDAAKSCGLQSFQGDTLVATPDGAVSIDALKVGDKVLATDAATGKVQAEPVQNVMIHLDSNLIDVTIADTTNAKPATPDATSTKQQDAETKAHGAQAPPTTETVHTTTEHPFLTAELGWVNAQDLKPGEHVRKLDGSLGVVTAVTVVTGTAVRYNLTVASDHTFAVGDGQWVVHNISCGEATTWAQKRGLQTTQHFLQRIADRGGNLAEKDLDHIIDNGTHIYDEGNQTFGVAAKVGKKGWHTIIYDGSRNLVSLLDESSGGYTPGISKFANGARWVQTWIKGIRDPL